MALDYLTANNSGVEAKVFAQLASWNLSRDQPVAVAFSGGGDSTALLSLLLKWSSGSNVYAFVIDHGLRAGSKGEAKLAQSRASGMGAHVEILSAQWPGGIPKSGIQEKARNVRYQLLAQACDQLRVENLSLFMGHNQDDQAETVLMRQNEGSGWRGLAGISARAPFPSRSTITDVQVLRPLLGCTRAELRTYNRENRLEWIDDPSNEDRGFSRIRAREHLDHNASQRELHLLTSAAARKTLVHEREILIEFISSNTKIYTWGGVALLRYFHTAHLGQSAEALKYILQAIAGQGVAPSEEKRLNLARRLRRPDFKGATLGGVRFSPAHGDIFCVRDLGALTGRHQKPPLAPLMLRKNVKMVWDARYGVSGKHGGNVEALANWLDHLSKQQRKALHYIPKPAWGGLPVFIRKGEIVFVPFLEHFKNETSKTGDYWAQSLTARRLYALLDAPMGEFE